jgi:Fur family ferric uptake transcriptional regulator
MQLRETKNKRLIRNILQSSTHPLSVPELLVALKTLHITINKTTVYRELESLITQDKLIELDFGEGKKRFEWNTKTHHHHLICKKCQKVEHIDMTKLESAVDIAEKEALENNNFTVTGHTIELFGLCGGCNK